jgi:hypothetical protein
VSTSVFPSCTPLEVQLAEENQLLRTENERLKYERLAYIQANKSLADRTDADSDEIERLRRIISTARQWVEGILPRPGPYHPAVAALFEELVHNQEGDTK